MKLNNTPLVVWLCWMLVCATAMAAEPTALQKPTWKLESSLTTGLTYDTNVYQTNMGAMGSQRSALLSVAPSWRYSGQWRDLGLVFNYTPSVYIFDDDSDINYLSQNIAAEQKFHLWGYDWATKESLVWVTGMSEMPTYTDDLGTTYTPGFTATSGIARTDQLTWRSSFNAVKKWDKYLVEFVGTGVYNDYRVTQKSTSGYLNLTDRFDANIGVNVGYKAYKDIYALLGYRAGYQFQGLNPTNTTQYSSAYHRYLSGLRGNITEKLSVDILAGIDVRDFKKAVASTFDRNSSFWTYQGTITYKATKDDTFSGTFSRAIQVGSTGGSAYEDITANVRYARVLTPTLSAEFGINMTSRPYLQGSATVIQEYTYYAPFFGLTYKPKGDLSYRLGYTWESVEADTPRSSSLPSAQEYTRSIVTLETKYKF